MLGSKVVFAFKKLEHTISVDEAEILLEEIIIDWKALAKRFTLAAIDRPAVKKYQFYAEELTKKYPYLKKKIFHNYYEEAICEFVGIKYEIKTDKQGQINLGIEPVLLAGKSEYLFPV